MAGFDNRILTDLMTRLLNTPYTNRQATYDLRRLRRKNLIERLPHTNRYQLTKLGRRVAVTFTKPTAACLPPRWPTRSRPTRRHRQTTSPGHRLAHLERELDRFIDTGLAAA